MSAIVISSSQFKSRIGQLQARLASNDVNSANSILIVTGASDEENPYQKTTILHHWLLGYEFPSTLAYINAEKTIFIVSAAKAKYLSSLKSANCEIWERSKDAEHNKKLFLDLIELLKKDSRVGRFPKDAFDGKFVTEWETVFSDAKNELEFVDISASLSQSLEIKDASEIKNITHASKCSSFFMDHFQNEMVNVVDEEVKISHAKLSEKIDTRIDDDKIRNQLRKKADSDFDVSNIDWCYTPIIQSGGAFDLRPSATSNDNNLHDTGVVIASLGMRYKSYCSNIGRTFLIDPSKQMEQNYDFLLLLQKHIVSLLKPGVKANELHAGALDFVKKERPELEAHFTKNCGWSIGLDFRDSSFVLGPKCDREIHSNDTFSLTIGFQGLSDDKMRDSKSRNYALVLSDTIRVASTGVEFLTAYTKSRSDISFYFKDETETVKKEVLDLDDVKREGSVATNAANSKILKSKLRTETKNHDESEEQRQKQIQKELHEKRQREGLLRFSDTKSMDPNERKVIFKKYDSYIRETQIPSFVRDLKIHVDSKAQTIILPMQGRPVPFHINSYKNGSKNEEGEYTYLRLNFNSPGLGGNTAKKDEIPYEDDPDKEFVRTVTFRSKDTEHMNEVFKQISDLKKESVKRENERKQLADVVEQARLIEAKPGRLRRLDNIFVRPAPDTKRVPGSLSIHENGLRYQSPLKQDSKIDILFSNIKHLFFQPSKDELIVIIHIHLKTPLMIGGKKKAFDVQFYREATDMAIDETNGKRRGGARRYGDDDELEQEQMERRRKAALDKEFRRFGELIADSSNGLVDLDIPFRELGFQGVPFRSATFMIPTRDCLVQLSEPPFLVVTLSEIEVAHLERVQFGLKNFDLVLIFKDFSKPVVHINTIPMEVLEDVKSWLSDVDIPYSDSTINLNWLTIMKTLQQDPKQFFLDGGWSFLAGGGSDDEGSEESDEESDFEASDLDPSDEEVESEAYSDDDEGSGSDFSGSGSGSGSGSEDDSDADDWDEMDRKAAKADKMSNFD
ncbi:hypothetical protein WICPIJ_004352 [Wickerhamomyces pijperi]|uniref:FACT complex subunit n=1 Tax=Wickerhamomyces pijperi TaxID=599730 RepID=A0A9P8TMZ7_WICPI|nr:hypothetical protein WICPIJ_004352 [Wickerhamomyces pijperi]